MILLFYTAAWLFPASDDETWTRELANSRGVSLPLLLSSNPIWASATDDPVPEAWAEKTKQSEIWTEKTKQAETWTAV